MRLKHFDGKYRYYAYATSPEVSERLMGQGLHVMLHSGLLCLLLPEQRCFLISQEECDQLSELSDGDTLANESCGRLSMVYQKASQDNAIVVTEKCNSNCIMCPVPEGIRCNTEDIVMSDLIERVQYIPVDADHITITGGEPFLAGWDLFALLQELRDNRNDTEYLMLTNGRIFADVNYVQEFERVQPSQMTIGIPIHGADAATHDRITQAPGSYEQTILGIRHLLHLGCSVEIRFVISGLNVDNITQMARLVAGELRGVDSVKFMGLEMTGNAAVYSDDVWISYQEAFDAARTGIDILLAHGITVELYNFPLCMVDSMYWPLCRKSISGYKIHYHDDCKDCRVKDACGGIFKGTQRLVRNVMPIVENGRA